MCEMLASGGESSHKFSCKRFGSNPTKGLKVVGFDVGAIWSRRERFKVSLRSNPGTFVHDAGVSTSLCLLKKVSVFLF